MDKAEFQAAALTGAAPGAAVQFDALTGLRGLAAWLVVLFHARVALTGTLAPWMLAIADKGYLAVDLFFILSGFVLWHSYGDRLRGTGLVGALRFWWRRIARIWPLHAVILGAFVLLATVLGATGRDTTMYPWAELPFHILLVQNWGMTTVLSWNDPAWSISCEMGAYLLFPLWVALAPFGGMGHRALVGIAAALLGAIWLYFAVQGTRTLGYEVPRLGLVRCLLEFGLGNVLCLLWQRWRLVHRAGLGAWVAMLGLLLGGVGLGLPETSFVPGCFATLILVLAMDDSLIARLLASPVPHYLGEISYSTYLVHFLLFVLFKLAFVQGTAHIDLAQLVAYLVIVLIASVILYHGVEKPAQRRLNALTIRRAPRAVPAE